MNRTAVIETLQGYARANDFIEHERIDRLARLTLPEARAIDQDLYSSWRVLPAWTKEGLERLDLFQVEALLIIRRALDALAKSKGFL